MLENHMDLPTFLSRVSNSLSSAPALANVISIDLSSDSLAALQNDLLDKSYNISVVVESRNYFSGDWNAFGQFITSYVFFVRDVNPYDMEESYFLVEKLFNDLQVAFSNRRGGLLTSVVRNLAGFVTSLAISLDAQGPSKEASQGTEFKSLPRTSEVSKVLLKIFNSIRAERFSNETSGEISKKEVILYVAVLLCRAYFKLNQPSACANVFSNIHTANIQFSQYPRSERVTYRYYLGRFYFLRQELLRARAHLSWAFANCMTRAVKNQRAILSYLIPVNLLTGVGTRPALYHIAGDVLREMFLPLEQAMRAGDLYAFNEHLVRHFHWFLSKQMFLILRSKAEIVIFRNLFRQIDLIVTSSAPPPEPGAKRLNDLSFAQLLAGIRLSTRSYDPELTKQASTPSATAPAIFPYGDVILWSFEDVENLCISLIKQEFLKGNIWTRSKLVRLMNSGGLPPMRDVYAKHLVAADNEKWMDS
ncbi:hypothetical protein V1512DRAFT_222204 [Lipomyces arxii]|uniref:uncharacterized protein n=1 Tax=Lipomyces arxii TaxID=56418 RepID=UPI0034CE16D7